MLTPRVAPELSARVEVARGRLDVVAARVEVDAVLVTVQHWETAGSRHFISADDVSADDENAAWKAVNDAVGRELRR